MNPFTFQIRELVNHSSAPSGREGTFETRTATHKLFGVLRLREMENFRVDTLGTTVKPVETP